MWRSPVFVCVRVPGTVSVTRFSNSMSSNCLACLLSLLTLGARLLPWPLSHSASVCYSYDSSFNKNTRKKKCARVVMANLAHLCE